MDMFIRRPPEFYRLYNCSSYDVDDVPLDVRQNIPLGLTYLTLSTVQFFLYIPCMVAIWKHMAKNSCYKFMFFMGALDMIALPVVGTVPGVLSIVGGVYCSAPTLCYLMGAFGFSLWVMVSSVEVLLALNRCVELSAPWLGETLFRGAKTWAWMALPTLYGGAILWATTPFAGYHNTWFYNPHILYADDYGDIYHNPMQGMHNWMVVVMLAGTYITFGAVLIVKSYSFRVDGCRCLSGGHSVSTYRHSYSQKMIFLQVALISALNIFGAIIYTIMQYYSVSETTVIISHIDWIEIHGIPPVIYLGLNRTLRRECAEIVQKTFCGLDRELWRAVSNARAWLCPSKGDGGRGGRCATATAHHSGGGGRHGSFNSTCLSASAINNGVVPVEL